MFFSNSADSYFLGLCTDAQKWERGKEKEEGETEIAFLAEHWHQPILHKTEGQHKKLVAKTEEEKKVRLRPV